jgi:hypothetical protein
MKYDLKSAVFSQKAQVSISEPWVEAGIVRNRKRVNGSAFFSHREDIGNYHQDYDEDTHELEEEEENILLPG